MDRRSFLRWIGGTAVGAAFAATADLERLLWVPGQKSIFLPAIVPGAFFHPGDVFTIEGQFAMNPVTGRMTNYPQYFMVTSTVTNDQHVIPIEQFVPRLTDRTFVPRRDIHLGWTFKEGL